MIETDEEFRIAAKAFFNTEGEFFNESFPFNIELLALEYVKKNDEFKYKDHVEAGVLVNCLVEFGYIEFSEIKRNTLYHSLTKKGSEFIWKNHLDNQNKN